MALCGCLASEPPLSPKEALELAATRIDAVLVEYPDAPTPASGPSTDEAGSPVELWYCAHSVLGPVLSYPEWRQELRRRHPEIDCDIDTQYLGDWSVAVQKLTVNIAVDDPPDIAMVDRSWLAALADAGRLAPLDDLLDARLVDDIRPAFRDTLSINGHLYGVPADGFVSLLVRRGPLSADLPMRTWTDLRDACRRVVDADPAMRPIGYFPFEEALWSAGGDICDAKTAFLRTAEAEAALQFVLGLRIDGFLDRSTWRIPLLAWQAFERGDVAMTVASSKHVPRLTTLDPTAAAGPVPGKHGAITRLSDYALVVFARHDPAKRPTIAAILDDLTGSAVQGESSLAQGSLPVRASVAVTLTLPGWDAALEHARATPLVAPLSAVEYEMERSLDRAYDWAEKQ